MKVEDFLKKHPIEIIEEKHPISKIKIREDYVMLFLEEDKIMIPIESYFSYGLKDLKGLDDDLLNRLRNEEAYLKAYRSCLRKLSVKDYTVKQIKDHLGKMDLDDERRKEIIDKLISYGMLDDEKYAQNKIAYYDRSNLSTRQIREKLKKDGINEEIINSYLFKDEFREIEKAKNIADRYSKTIRNKSLAGKKQSILNRLVSSGYSYEISKNIVNELDLSRDNEIELLKKEYLKAKNKYGKKYSDYELKQRIYGSLLNKGFSSDDIKKVMEV
ncbi:MAG: RecX family transcriptional regulator [Erysipelotrichaceae bacterium]|nr:RecX family transcriptional regulator [Erysipelotrichaceae bacterium]